uniref:Major intrinsic protein n=1 Tax=viral metagenome TaxID=1070528 RepID=A0A6C0H618_9ZZZZ
MHKYFAEFIGTLLLTFVIIKTGNYFAIGLILAICVFIFEGVSDCCFNPAVAIAFFHMNKISQNDLFFYIIVEICGALVAVEIVKLIKL